MESYQHEQSKDLRWLLLLGAAAGTLLLGFVPSAAWLTVAGDGDPLALLLSFVVKQVLTVLLLCAVPSLWARLAQRTNAFSLLGLSLLAYGVGFWTTKDPVQALYTLLLVALPGVGLYAVQKLGCSNFRAVLYESAILLVALFGYVCLPDLIANGDAYLPFRTVIGAYEQIVKQTQTLLGIAESDTVYADLAALLDMTAEYRLNAEAFGVPVLLVPAMAAGLSNVLLSHLYNRHGGVELKPLPPFSEWRCERPFVIAAVVFALVTFFLQYTGWNGVQALAGVGSILWRLPCALAGLCAVRRLSMRAKKNWIFVIACCVLGGMPLMALPVIAILGLLASLRNRTNVGEDGTQP